MMNSTARDGNNDNDDSYQQFFEEWDFSHVLIVFGFLAVNIVPVVIAMACVGSKIKRYNWKCIQFLH